MTDGSDLYPAVLTELWPSAAINCACFTSSRSFISWSLMRCGGCVAASLDVETEDGSDGGTASANAKQRRRSTLKEKSTFIFKHRFLIVQRRDRMSRQDRLDPEHDAQRPPGVEAAAPLRGRLATLVCGGYRTGRRPGDVISGRRPNAAFWRCPSGRRR